VRICDIRDRDAIESLAEFAWTRMGGVDLLFNNAGVGRTALAFDLADEDIAWQIEVNLIGTIQGTRIFGRRMLAEPGRGWICNTASQAGISARDPLPTPRPSMASSATPMRCAAITATGSG
jgi:3-oxoacyl-[acyl-carrier protein] reductase